MAPKQNYIGFTYKRPINPLYLFTVCAKLLPKHFYPNLLLAVSVAPPIKNSAYFAMFYTYSEPTFTFKPYLKQIILLKAVAQY